ncbi:hypothetical protein Hypma_007039 [Hypsizygus marmoreus]|uniref:Uncharacterized protein n=1 Tax=Hypsizygus marmoreus TaxID=39966 RepID=A0A369KHG1_HYPMA|nr:hypothetical protein Hypma_007039 [Hypsizygus marmoreus]
MNAPDLTVGKIRIPPLPQRPVASSTHSKPIGRSGSSQMKTAKRSTQLGKVVRKSNRIQSRSHIPVAPQYSPKKRNAKAREAEKRHNIGTRGSYMTKVQRLARLNKDPLVIEIKNGCVICRCGAEPKLDMRNGGLYLDRWNNHKKRHHSVNGNIKDEDSKMEEVEAVEDKDDGVPEVEVSAESQNAVSVERVALTSYTWRPAVTDTSAADLYWQMVLQKRPERPSYEATRQHLAISEKSSHPVKHRKHDFVLRPNTKLPADWTVLSNVGLSPSARNGATSC